jgi:hypothetical protein
VFNNFFRKSYRFWDKVEKYGGARVATNDVTIWRIRVARWIGKASCTHAHAHAQAAAITDAHTQICNTYCFSTATVVTWTRLSVTLYVHSLSCYLLSNVSSPKKEVGFSNHQAVPVCLPVQCVNQMTGLHENVYEQCAFEYIPPLYFRFPPVVIT